MKQYVSKILISVLLLLLAACTPDMSPTESVVAAKRAINNKQWASAQIYLKAALSQHSEAALVSESEIRFLLGRVYLGQGDMLQAERFLLPVVAASFQLNQSVSWYARALFHQEKFDLLNSTIARYQGKDSELDIELSLYKVLVLHKTGNTLPARALLAVISEQVQDSAFALFTQAYTQASESPTRALALIEQLFSLDPDYADAYLLKGQLSFYQKNFDTAYGAFRQYLNAQPRAYHVHFLMAMAALQQGKTDVAQEHVTILLKINNNHPLANHLQALIAFGQKHYQVAKKHAEISIQFGLTLPVNYLIAGVSALNLEQDHQAYQHLIKAAKGMPTNNQVKKILTLIQFKLGYLQDAAENFDSLALASDTDFSLGNMLASQLLVQQDNSAAKAILAKLQFAPVVEPLLKLQQGVLQLEAGDINGLAILETIAEQAVKQIDEADAAGNMTQIAFIMALADTGNINKAIIQAQQWQQQSPSNINAMNILALLYQKNNEPEHARLWYQNALNHDPENIPSLLFYAYLAANNGDKKHAGKLFLQILTLKPNHARAFAGLLKVTLQVTPTPDWQSLQSLVDLSAPASYKSNNVLLMLAQAMYQMNEMHELQQYLNDNTEQKYWSNGLWRLWLQTQLASKDEKSFNDALIKFNRLFSDIENQLFVISLLEKEKRFQAMLDVIEFFNKQKDAAKQINSNIQYAKAYALLSLGKVPEAEFLIFRLEQKQPLPALNYLQGLLALIKEDVTSAITFFEAHFAQQPTLPGLMQLASLYLKTDATDKLVILGERYLSVFPNDSHARMLLSQWLTHDNKVAAIRFLDVSQSQRFIAMNWQVANNLAWLYLNSDNKERALAFSRLAFARQPEQKEVAFTHAIALMHHGRNDEALHVLSRIDQANNDIRQLIKQLENAADRVTQI